MFSNILVVCIGNICRSPMAEALLRARAPASVRIHSAGISALVGAPADPASIKLMQERGIDITAHCAQQLTREMALQADLILVMETSHQRHIHSILQSSHGKVHCLGKWEKREIPDPYNKSPEFFKSACTMIEEGVDAWAKKLWKQ